MKTALVTGATGGIGKSLVRALCDRGLTVHAIGRNQKVLHELERGTGCIGHCIDLAGYDGFDKLAAQIPADILVNCAGVGAAPGPLHDTGQTAIDTVLDVNLRAPLHLIASFIPGMVKRAKGHIINIGSVAGIHAIPNVTAYAASKSAIHALSSLLRLDLQNTPLRVSEICPGRVETGFFAAISGDREQARKTYFDDYQSLQPDDVRDAVLFALDAPDRVNVSLIELTPQRQVYGGINFAPGRN